MADKKIQIRNITVDFMVFTKDAGSDSIEVRVQDGFIGNVSKEGKSNKMLNNLKQMRKMVIWKIFIF